MYECVMGMSTRGQGCILADEMGLGKTIQSIALIWTLLSELYTSLNSVRGPVLNSFPALHRAKPLSFAYLRSYRSHRKSDDRLSRYFDQGPFDFSTSTLYPSRADGSAGCTELGSRDQEVARKGFSSSHGC